MSLVFLVIWPGMPAVAQSSRQLKSQKAQLEKDIANTQNLLRQTEKNKKASLQQIAVLRRQISNREELITALNNEIFLLEEEQDDNAQAIGDLKKRLEYMKSDYSQVVYMAYRNRRLMDKVVFVLAADDFSQMIRRLRFYTVFSRNVREQAEKIVRTQEELNRKNEAIIQMKEEKLLLLSGKEREIQQLEVDRRKKTRNADKLKSRSNELTRQLRRKQQKRREVDLAIKRTIEKEIAAANARRTSAAPGSAKAKAKANELMMTPEEKTLSSSFVNNRGILPWPVAKGTKIGSFGSYPHPDVPSVQIENRGIDILVEPGTEVRSVFKGEVTGVMEIMGTKVLMVRHGEYMTVYQNLAEVYVNKGDKVRTKQKIGKIAKNTTTDTYELHFELWKNNKYLNPSDWLARR